MVTSLPAPPFVRTQTAANRLEVTTLPVAAQELQIGLGESYQRITGDRHIKKMSFTRS